jgi:phenylacetyl-CoA:acceptor oxidoreductase subunit 2
VFAALGGAHGTGLALPMLAGLALVGLGLLCVWLEIGRPWRALNVFRNPRTSWMSREAYIAVMLGPTCLAAAVGVPALPWAAAALALLFVYAQSRLVQAARGIPAWREPLAAPWIVVTGLAEGGGLYFVLSAWQLTGAPALMPALMPPVMQLFGALVLARGMLWMAYRRALAERAPRADRALNVAGPVLMLAGTALPLVLMAVAVSSVLPRATPALLAIAGLSAAAAGAWVKVTLVTRAGFNQGFALAKLPVRGVRR